MTFVRFFFRVLSFIVWFSILIIPFLLARWPYPEAAKGIAKLWNKGACYIVGLKVNSFGDFSHNKPLLIISNHTSYLDIPVLGSICSFSFISKKEVMAWPVIGWLAKMCDTVFVERRPIKSREQVSQLRRCVLGDRKLVLFAEGTTTDGSKVLPFKSSLLEFVFTEGIVDEFHIQPVTILCPDLSCSSSKTSLDAFYPWYDETSLGVHFFRLLMRKRTHVNVFFHAPERASFFQGRKELANWAQQHVESGHKQILQSS